MKQLLNILKDKASLVKASLATKRDIYLIHKAIIHATAESNTSPPPEYSVATIINLGHDTRQVARACIEAIIDRLHNNGNPYVKLKSLIIIHNIIFRGTFILRDQLMSIRKSDTPLVLVSTSSEVIVADEIQTDDDDDDPATNNLNNRLYWWPSERRNSEKLELLWRWVIWYTNVLEGNLKTSSVLGCFISSSTYPQFEKFKHTDSMNRSLEKHLLKEMGALILMIEEICTVPPLIQDCSLVSEIVLLVSQEYGCLQHQIMMRLNEFSQRVDRLSLRDTSELLSYLNRLKNCKKTLNQMYENRKRNNSFWELIYKTKYEIEKYEERREMERIRVETAIEIKRLTPPPPQPQPQPQRAEESNLAESTQTDGQVMRVSRALRYFACCGIGDMAVERVHLTGSKAI